jgi:PAS domain S-box-containing protein
MQKSSPQEQITALRGRVSTLYRNASAAQQAQELLPVAFAELESALEVLQALQEELHRQHEQVLITREQVEAEFQAHKDLFVKAPVAYMITSPIGVIRQANQAAAALFSSTEKSMIGRSLILFVPEGERRAFRARLAQIARSQQTELWEAHMQSWRGVSFRAALTTSVAYGRLGHPALVRWIIQDTAARAARGELHVEPAERSRMVGDSGLD